jgi:hypothetical protein
MKNSLEDWFLLPVEGITNYTNNRNVFCHSSERQKSEISSLESKYKV